MGISTGSQTHHAGGRDLPPRNCSSQATLPHNRVANYGKDGVV